MIFKDYVKIHITQTRRVEIKSDCCVNEDGTIETTDGYEEEVELSFVGINSLFFECDLCGMELDEDKNVRDHFEDLHKGEK
jgi:hypothetical protein